MGQYVMSSMTWLVLWLVIQDPTLLQRERLDGKRTYHPEHVLAEALSRRVSL